MKQWQLQTINHKLKPIAWPHWRAMASIVFVFVKEMAVLFSGSVAFWMNWSRVYSARFYELYTYTLYNNWHVWPAYSVNRMQLAAREHITIPSWTDSYFSSNVIVVSYYHAAWMAFWWGDGCFGLRFRRNNFAVNSKNSLAGEVQWGNYSSNWIIIWDWSRNIKLL